MTFAPAVRSPRPVRLTAEAFGSAIVVLGIVSTSLFAASFGEGTDAQGRGVGHLGVAVAAGIALVAAIHSLGPISGGHFNPAVSVGLAAAGRMPWREVPGYVIAQTVGGVVASTLVFLVGLFGPDGWLEAQRVAGFASNGFGTASPSGFGMGAAMLVEALFAAVFVIVILGVTHPARGTALAGVVIGLTYTLIHLALLPIDGASVNPARSIATALYGDTESFAQLWVFLVFPVLGALIAGLAYRGLFDAGSRGRAGTGTDGGADVAAS